MTDGSTRAGPFRARHRRVRQAMLDRIQARRWRDGDMLPNEARLAAEFDASVGSVRRALQELSDAGMVLSEPGRGRFITADPSVVEERFTVLFPHSARRCSLSDLWATKRPATADERTLLALTEPADVIVIRQLLTEGVRKLGVEASVLPEPMFPGLLPCFTQARNLYPAFCEHGVLPKRAYDVLAVIGASPQLATELETKPGEPMFQLHRKTFDLDGTTVELRTGFYLASEFTYRTGVGE